MAYSTIPADLESEATLLNKPKPKTSFKTLVGGAALAAFVLGALAASAVSTASPAVHAPAAMHAKSSVQAPVLDGKSDEIYEHRHCKMPKWMKEPLKTLKKVPAVFNDDPTDFLPDKSLYEIVEPGSDEYCQAFNALDNNGDPTCGTGSLTCPGAALFGDVLPVRNNAWYQSGLGGINNFAVIKVKPGALVELYGGRKLNHYSGFEPDAASNPGNDVWNVWFADSTSFTNPLISFEEYSNNRMALAFSKTHFAKCTLKPGALVVIGSGGWRNTTLTGYTAEDGLMYGNTPKNIHIDEVQTPEAKWLHYVLNVHDAAQDCSYWPLNVDAMWNSMQGEGTQFISNGEYLPTKKQQRTWKVSRGS